MTKAELIDDIAKRSGLSRAQSKLALEAFVSSVTANLKKGEEVRLVGFGSFTPIVRAAGMARNPRTGAAVKRAASRTARFRIGEALKSALN
ncbi:MAG TPA: HU family DNA-binding protein [Caulobacteraceae bacterium]|nr:HU family DNA-binding protein [Caulobacteraceae bacterium]